MPARIKCVPYKHAINFPKKEQTMMNKIRISDVTMKQTGPEISLSFREKIEMSKLLDKLGVDIIELEPIV